MSRVRSSKFEGVDKKVGTQKQPGPSTWLSWLLPLVIFLLTVVAFFPVLQNGFVNWDDDRNLIENPNYRGLGWTQLRWMFTTFHMTLYRPLTWVTLGFDYVLWGMNPFGYHLTSLLLHAANAVLFYFVSFRLLASAQRASASREFALQVAAGFSAFIFAFHPLRVEPVAWASARNDVLSGLFFLGTFLCYLRASAIPQGDHARLGWMIAAVIIYGLSLLSKASSMTLPIVLLVLDVYPLKRLGGGPEKWFGPDARRVWWEKVPFVLLAVGAGAIALLAKHRAIYSFEELGVLPRLAQGVFGLAFYLWKTVIPQGLSPLYQLSTQPHPWDSSFLLSGVVVLGTSIGLFAARHRWPAGLASWVCYVVILSPVLGFAQSGPQIVADRYTYLSCLAWAILAGAGLLYCCQLWVSGYTRSRIFVLVSGLAVAMLSVFGVLTWKQTRVWRDSERLWRHALSVERRSSYAHNSLGNALFDRGEVGEAIEHYREALEINPVYARAHNNLGNALFVRGELREAVEHFRQAVGIEPGYAKAHHNLGVALAKRGEFEEAIEHFREAVRSDPGYGKARYNLGVALARRGELEEAIEHFRQVVLIEPGSADAHESLGRALALQGKRDEAAKHLEQAVRILKSSPASR